MKSERDTTERAKFIIPLLIAIISLFATSLSIRFDIFYPFPPKLGRAGEELVFKDKIDGADSDDMTYIFALDVSSNYNEYRMICPSWYNEEKKRINDFISDSQNDFGNDYSEKPTLYKLCKLKLCQLIMEFREENANFEIWTIGDEGNERYRGRFGNNLNGKQSTKEAIKAIVNLSKNTDPNTDFISFFDRLVSNHPDLPRTIFDEFRLPKMAIIIISDFLHDVKAKEKLDPQLPSFKTKMDEQRAKAKDKIEKLSRADTMIGAVIITPQNPKPYEIQLLNLVETQDNFSLSRLKRISIERQNNELLFPSVKSCESVRFSYNYGFKVLNSPFYLRFEEAGKYLIGLSNPFTGNRIDSVNYEIVNTTKNIEEEKASKKGILKTEGEFETFELDGYERIKLIYKDFPPGDKVSSNLKICFSNSRRMSYCVPIQFEKRPLSFEVWVQIILWGLLMSSILFFLLYGFYLLGGNMMKKLSAKRNKKDQLEDVKPIEEGKKEEQVSNEKPKSQDDSRIQCPYPECPDGSHPKGTKYCPRTGKSLKASEEAPMKADNFLISKIKKIRENFKFIIIALIVAAAALMIYLLSHKPKTLEMKVTETAMKVTEITFTDLEKSEPQIAANYENQLKNLAIFPAENNIKVSGQMELNITIDEKGKIYIQSDNSSDLKVFPGNAKQQIIDKAKEKILAGAIIPEKGNNGTSFKVTDIIIKLPLKTSGVIEKFIDYSEPGINAKYKSQLDNYRKQLSFLEKLSLEKDSTLKVSGQIGQIELHLTIGENGRIELQEDSNYAMLTAAPEAEKKLVIEKLKSKIEDLLAHKPGRVKLLKGDGETLLKVRNFSIMATVTVGPNIVRFPELPKDKQTQYSAKMEDLGELLLQDIGKDVTVKGEVRFKLTIDEQGAISIQDNTNYDSLIVTPEGEKESIIRNINARVQKKIEALTLLPYSNESGAVTKVIDFEITVNPVKMMEIDFKNLAPGIITDYQNQLGSMGEVSIQGNIAVNGQMRLRLTIEEGGNIHIQGDSQYTLLNVNPGSKREEIIEMLKQRIEEFRVTPRKNEDGALLKVTNFPVTVRVIQNGNRLILGSLEK